MQADLPHTLYNRRKERPGNGGGGGAGYRVDPDDPAIRMQAEAVRRHKERQEAAGKNVEYTMDEIFNQESK